MTLSWLELFQEKTPQILGQAGSQPPYRNVSCDGTYQHHLQGICVDGEAIYWSFTTTLVKTDLNGNLLKQVPVANHHGDLAAQLLQLHDLLSRYHDLRHAQATLARRCKTLAR
jgi:hypothetical protein